MKTKLALILLLASSVASQAQLIFGSGIPGDYYFQLPVLNPALFQTNIFTNNQYFIGQVVATNSSNFFGGDGSRLVNIPASAITGLGASFSGNTSQVVTVAGLTSIISGATVTNLGVVSNLTLGNLTNAFSFTGRQAMNYVQNTVYTNQTGRSLFVSTQVALTPATIAGNASEALVVVGKRLTVSTAPSILTLLIPPQTNQLFDLVDANDKFYFTNVSTGVGNTAATTTNGFYEIH